MNAGGGDRNFGASDFIWGSRGGAPPPWVSRQHLAPPLGFGPLHCSHQEKFFSGVFCLAATALLARENFLGVYLRSAPPPLENPPPPLARNPRFEMKTLGGIRMPGNCFSYGLESVSYTCFLWVLLIGIPYKCFL